MNYLDLAPIDRPNLPTRERLAGKLEVQCPICGHWRAARLFDTLSPGDAAVLGAAWACDAERTTLVREAVVNPPETPTHWLPLSDFMALFSFEQQARATAADAPDRVRVLVLQTTTYPAINLLDPRVIGGIDLLAADGVLDPGDVQNAAAEAARIKAGTPPPLPAAAESAP